MERVESGLEALMRRELHIVAGLNVGLIANHSAVTSTLVPAVDALISAGVRVRALFAPEHGPRGEIADGEHVPASVDQRTGLPIHSLYGATKRPTPEMLDGLDVLIFDIQDIGARFYTFLYTMAYAMQACAEMGLPFVVLDRPNPIGGAMVEGPVLNPRFASFVGLYPIPIRFGMTIGELARMFNDEFGIGVDLRVAPLNGWRREMWFDDTGLPWVAPSPNIPTLDTATIYPGTCLVEGTNVSEGRGTSAPFRLIGAPWIDSAVLSDELESAGLPGVEFIPSRFVPKSSKYAGQECRGVELRVVDRSEFRPVLTGLKTIEIIRRTNPAAFEFREPGVDGRRFFDLLAGTDKVRIDLEAGLEAEEIAATWAQAISEFENVRDRHLLY